MTYILKLVGQEAEVLRDVDLIFRGKYVVTFHKGDSRLHFPVAFIEQLLQEK